MTNTQFEFESLSSREGFNKNLRHFKAVMSVISRFTDQENIAEIVNDLLEEKTIHSNQTLAIVHALLIDKYGYHAHTMNLPETIEDFSKMLTEVQKWNAVDIVFLYHNPEMGAVLANPKDGEHLESLQLMRKNELVTIYVGAYNEELDIKTADIAINNLIKLLTGDTVRTPATLKNGDFVPPEKEEEAPEAAEEEEEAAEERAEKTPKEKSGRKRMTPFYSVPVTNELFHNGNVEAWKKIIMSYTTKYPDADVYIYYDGEPIHDINTLFKWGKVKHGSSILFRVAGFEIKDIAKLRRYLRQGASHQFEDFLRFPVNKVLDLF